MRIGIIGTGNVAKALTPKFTAAGHEVFLASREPVGKAGLPAPVKDYKSLKDADVIIIAVPGALELETLRAVGADTLRGKVLIDVGNALDQSYNLAYPVEGLALQIQAAFPEARVVKALNTFGTGIMTSPGSLSARSTTFISGNDAEAKKIATDLHEALGWGREEVLDLGPIQSSLAQERYFSMFMAIYGATGNPAFNIAVIR